MQKTFFDFFSYVRAYRAKKGALSISRHRLGCQCLKLSEIGRTKRPRRRVETVSGCGAPSGDAPYTLLASTYLHGDILTSPDVISRIQDVLQPNFGFIITT